MTDTMKTINCPACGKIMQKILTHRGFAIDVCTEGCGGIFFDNHEIHELNASETDINEIKKVLNSKNFIPLDENVTRICPCGTKMVKTKVSGVQIDTCYNCNGVFLDNGEFELVRSHFKKRPKVLPVDMNKESEINLREFCGIKDNNSSTDKKISFLDVLLDFLTN